MKEYPHVPAAFIKAIAEEGTKAEAIEWLQKKWNECCALRAENERLKAEQCDSPDAAKGESGEAEAQTLAPASAFAGRERDESNSPPLTPSIHELVERLRAWSKHNRFKSPPDSESNATAFICNEAADALERMEREINETHSRLVGDAEGYAETIATIHADNQALQNELARQRAEWEDANEALRAEIAEMKKKDWDMTPEEEINDYADFSGITVKKLIRKARSEALEEAARVADRWMAPAIGEENKVAPRIAAAIRALKGEKE